jgi:glycerate 2-kinase
MDKEPRAVLRALFDEAVAAADPAICLPPYLPPHPPGRLVVVGAGKAAASMALAAEAFYGSECEGLVITRYAHGLKEGENLSSIALIEAGHPVPDDTGVEAAWRIKALAAGLHQGDMLLCLLSGGASSLMVLPAPGITLAEKQAITRALLNSGAKISEINCVRRHLSGIKGGRLAEAAYPTPTITCAISDVPGDKPGDIGSGPTVGDPTTALDARLILERYAIPVSAAVTVHLKSGEGESPKPTDLKLSRAEFRLIASADGSLKAAAKLAEAAGYRPVILGGAIEGESRVVAQAHARITAEALGKGRRLALISGGETTVEVRSPAGQGGRNTEYLLALAWHLGGQKGVTAIACDTDGIDGTGPFAGAVIDSDTLKRGKEQGLDASWFLSAHNAGRFFELLGDTVTTGPTRTNVNDFRAILIEGT